VKAMQLWIDSNKKASKILLRLLLRFARNDDGRSDSCRLSTQYL
jgi:hypothetical protein